MDVEVVKVRPVGILVTLDFSLPDLEKLKEALELASPINFDGKDPRQQEINLFINKFYDLLSNIIKDLRNGS